MSFGRPTSLILIVVLSGSHTTAQSPGTATLEGRIIDETGVPLPGVLMTVSNPSAPLESSTIVTDSEGRYSFQMLPPGAGYSLTASIEQYARIVAGPIQLEPGRTTRLDLTMKRSSEMEETVRVEAHGEIVDLSSTATTTTYNAEFIEALPLVGRRFSDILTLAPGVTDTDGDGSPNVRGARDTGLQVRLDGADVTDPLTGHVGQHVNLEAIQEVELITSGAPAEYGRADGGFANVITKSGGNELSGSVKLFVRSDFLDGDGANQLMGDVPRFDESDIYVTLGGPFVRDRFWYFAAIERLDEAEPIPFPNGTFGLQSAEGWRSFAKLTLQPASSHRLALQLHHDPLEARGNNIGPTVDHESDFSLKTAGAVPQLTWTAILSPRLLKQTTFSYLRNDIQIEPVSDHFGLIPVSREFLGNQFRVHLPCSSPNCQMDPDIRRFYLVGKTGRSPGVEHEDGAYNIRSDMDVERATVRSDLTLTTEGAAGQHAIKTGFEFNVERYSEVGVINPVLTDRTCDASVCLTSPVPVPPGANFRQGNLFLEIYDPQRFDRRADGLRTGWYLQNSWKPRSNLSINAGLRLDHERIDSSGLTDFNPLKEAREVLRRFDLLCDAAGSSCSRDPGRPVGQLPGIITPPAGHPALKFDLNGDGQIETAGTEGALVFEPYTEPDDLASDPFFITNSNLSPRLGFSWDPWADGQTKLFGTWGVYYDRLFLATVTTGQLPSSYTALWRVRATAGEQAFPGAASIPTSGVVSINQTDLDLSTPYTVGWTAGIERELAPEWAATLAYIRRRGLNLLQDVDVNHITCKQFDTAYGVDPMAVCGDAGRLELDRFGEVSSGTQGTARLPNGAIDLYVLNREFNQILRVRNANESEYTAAELTLRKRLHRNWQMLLGYTWSRAEGDAESFVTQEGNDPAVSDKVSGFLDYDQRHVFKLQVASHLPRSIVLGGTIEWASGLPFTFVDIVADEDDAGTVTPQRVFSVTGRKNDQRNEPQITINGRIEKRFNVGRATVSGFLEGENLLDNDELRLRQVDIDARSTLDGTRRFGRRWEIGLAVLF